MVMSRTWWPLPAVCMAVAVMAYWLTAAPSGPRSIREFDPGRTADLELRTWQAYDARARVRMFALVVAMLREQYHYSWSTAAIEGFHLARAAARFGDTTSDYEIVLPDLEAAYETARRWLSAGFDPRDVARAELAWWAARRAPGENDPDQVGRLIAREYALLYEAPLAEMMRPGVLRAEAAALRDSGAGSPDWPAIGGLLSESYRALRANLSAAAAD
jgi:hypothetical protein